MRKEGPSLKSGLSIQKLLNDFSVRLARLPASIEYGNPGQSEKLSLHASHHPLSLACS